MTRIKTQIQSRRFVLVIILLISLVGAGVMFFATRWGPWAYSDGVGYIVNARNLLHGDGLGLWRASGRFVATSHHPPFYIIALASLGFIGVDPLIAARCLSVSLFALMILVIGLSSYSITRNGLLAISLSGVTLNFPILIRLYSGVMSEGLFFLLGFSALLTAILGVQRRDLKYAAASGILSGFAFLTRYIGVGFVVACVIVGTIFLRLPVKQRIRRAVFLISLGVFPVVVWLAWLRFQSAAEPVRLFVLSAGNLWTNLQPVREALVDSFWRFLPFVRMLPELPYRWSLTMLTGVFLFLGIFSVYPWLRRSEPKVSEEGAALLNLTLVLFSVTYIFGLIFSFLFTLPTPDFTLRTLSPALFALTLSLVICAFNAVSLRRQTGWLVTIPFLFAVSIMAMNCPENRDQILSLFREGRGYTSPAWQSSPTIEAIQGINPDVPLISNESAAILFYTDRKAYDFPAEYAQQPAGLIARFGEDTSNATSRIFREEGAALVLFDSIFQQLEPLYHERTTEIIEGLTEGLDIFFDSADGAIYFYPGNSSGS